MTNFDFISEEKQNIIKNIEKALAEGNTYKKVSLGDPTPTDEDIKRVILPFDNKRTSPVSKFKSFLARKLAEKFTREVNRDTEIVGLENALSVFGRPHLIRFYERKEKDE